MAPFLRAPATKARSMSLPCWSGCRLCLTCACFLVLWTFACMRLAASVLNHHIAVRLRLAQTVYTLAPILIVLVRCLPPTSPAWSSDLQSGFFKNNETQAPPSTNIADQLKIIFHSVC